MVAAIAGGYLARRIMGNTPAMSPRHRGGVLFGAFCGAMIGAKSPYLWSDWDALVSGIVWIQNGKTILAGLAGGYAGVELAKWCFGIQTRTGDSLAVPIAIAISIGRWGCFHAGCCYGIPSDASWATVFPLIDALPRHPTQIYESLFHLIAALLMATVIKLDYRGAEIFRGNMAKAYIITYATYRLATETIRPEPRLIASITGYQLGAVTLALVMTALWYRDLKQTKILNQRPD